MTTSKSNSASLVREWAPQKMAAVGQGTVWSGLVMHGTIVRRTQTSRHPPRFRLPAGGW